MATENYGDILNTQWDDIPEPKVLPEGSWRLRAQNASYQPAKGEDGSPSVLFAYKVKEPMDDVPEDELAKLGPDYDFGLNTVFSRFWVNEPADWVKIKKHLAKMGVSTEGQSPAESLKEVKGAEVIAFLQQRSYTNNAGQDVTDNTPVNFVEA